MLGAWMAAQFEWWKGLLSDRQVHHPRVHRQFKLVQSTLVPGDPFGNITETSKAMKSRTRHATSLLRRVSVPSTSVQRVNDTFQSAST